MKRFIILLACSGNLLQIVSSQNTGKWHSYLAYNNTTSVAEGNTFVYALADGSLYSYGKEDNSLRYYSKENGLSDNRISTINFHSEENILIIAYTNGNIDLMKENNSVYNLPFILNSSHIQDKTIYSVYNYKETTYLATAFGIVALDVKKKEIKETYRLNQSISSIVVHEDMIYALTPGGIQKAALKDNLIDPGNWHDHPVTTSGEVKDTVLQLCTFRNVLCFLIKNKGIYYQSGNEIQQLLSHTAINNIKVENQKLIAFSSGELFIYSSFTEKDKGNITGIADISSLKDQTTFWLATGEKGLIGIRKKAADQYEILTENISNNGPKRNLNAFMRMQNNKLYIAGGGRWTDRFDNRGTVMIYDTDSLKWNNLKDFSGFRDATCIAVDHKDEHHFFVSSWGEGVYEFKDGGLLKLYNHKNSSLSTIIPNTPSENNYIRVEGVCFDKDNNLWMTNTEVSNVITVLKADGTWTKLPYSAISNPTLADKILIASNGHKWVNLVRGEKSGIFVFDDKGTIDNTSDDISHYYNALNDNNGNIGANEFLCITEDKNGAIWIGTNRGTFIVSIPSRAVEGTMTGSRIIHTDEYGNPQYFLADERINAIATDDGNRKWLGTGNSGIYLLSEDGSEIILHFTTDNSPLLSNTIESIAINNRTGEVFIGTDKGLISYMGDAIKGSENYSNVYAYPNPVRPGFDERVIITGLMDNSNVKITDASGNIIYQGRSAGGQITWNCRNNNGRRVASGIYLVFSSTPEAKESVVSKIAVVSE
jgi:ligand-binding sensor domain-containing protein